jgi:nitrite reductase/ring-hydroxylating ferredoxin subunit
MAEHESAPVRLCAADELVERGDAVVFDVVQWRDKATAFAMRFDGEVVAYLNRCVHVPTEMDWEYGKFLDSGRDFIMCSIHGASYNPSNGRCVGGPCGRGSLTKLRVEERDQQVYWYPSPDTRPAPPTSASDA